MNSKIEKKLWKKVGRYIKALQIVPFVRMISICNNLAFGKVNENSDIDLFIIAKKGRLFTVRIFITFLLHIFGVRRHGDKIKSRFCLSFFIDESHLDLSPIAISHDIYLAFWIKSMIPLIVYDDIIVKFEKSNEWAFSYFEESEGFSIDTSRILKCSRVLVFLNKVFKLILSGKVGNFIERKLKAWQIGRSNKKMFALNNTDGILIGDNILKFHNIDRRREYSDRWGVKFGDRKITNERFISL